MKLLIDECVDERVRLLFPGHECQTARFANLAGLKTDVCWGAAEVAGFDVLLTVDQNIPDAGGAFRVRFAPARGRSKGPLTAASLRGR
jgi:hypothetical protein